MTCSASCRSEVRPACPEVAGNGHMGGAPAGYSWGQVCQSGSEFPMAGEVSEGETWPCPVGSEKRHHPAMGV